MGIVVVEPKTCYGCEVWIFKKEEQRKLLVLGVDYFKENWVSEYQNYKIPSNTTIKNKMQTEQFILYKIQIRQLKWYCEWDEHVTSENGCWESS